MIMVGAAGAAAPESPSRSLLRSLSSRLIEIPEEPSSSSAQTNPTESDPLNPTPAARQRNRQYFQQHSRSVAQTALFRHFACSLCLLAIIMLVIFGVGIYFYIRGWIVYTQHGGKPCDQPLAIWLILQLLMPLLTIFGGRGVFGQLLRIVPLFLAILGFIWLTHAKTCPETNPELYWFVRAYLIFIAAVWLFWFTLTVVVASVFIYGMTHGWFETNEGASADTVDKIETVEYDPELFADPKVPGDSRPDGECCCCMENFSKEKEIKRTKCLHYFHTDCLRKWLKNAKSCPLCRSDLEASVNDQGEDIESGGAGGGEKK